MNVFLSVALGGAMGAVSRHIVGGWVGGTLGTGLPWGTFAVNVIGSFALGVIIEISALAWSPSPEMRAFLTVGFLGGFTTFSAFSMDVVLLIERGRIDLAALYAAASFGLALAGLFAGLRLMRGVLA